MLRISLRKNYLNRKTPKYLDTLRPIYATKGRWFRSCQSQATLIKMADSEIQNEKNEQHYIKKEQSGKFKSLTNLSHLKIQNLQMPMIT